MEQGEEPQKTKRSGPVIAGADCSIKSPSDQCCQDGSAPTKRRKTQGSNSNEKNCSTNSRPSEECCKDMNASRETTMSKDFSTEPMNFVDELLKKPFQNMTFQERLEVKRLGPHQPHIVIKQSSKERGKEINRKFSQQWFEKKKWLCASISKSALFCFPCLLFGGDAPWTKSGVTDIKHLPDKIKKHEACTTHIENCLKLGTFGTVDIGTQVNRTFLISIRKHNEEVDRNRHILSKLIDCIRFCGAFELSLCGTEKSEWSSKNGVYLELVDFVACIDTAMEQHLKTSAVFKGIFKTIQNELLDCMFDVIRQVILQEIKEAEFIAVQVNEITNMVIRTQSALVYRYIHKNKVIERFFGFTALEGSYAETTAASVLENLTMVFPEPNDKKRLIAQSYDGISMRHGESGGLQTKVKDIYPNAHYVHCYAHQLEFIIQQVASKITPVRVFFCGLSAMAAYFSQSQQKTAVLNEVLGSRRPRVASVRLNFNIRTVNVVFELKQDLIDCFKAILSCAQHFDTASVSEAKSYARLLEDREFLYFLYLFCDIMTYVDLLYSQLQRRDIDNVLISKVTSDFTSSIQKISDSIESIEGRLPEVSAHVQHSREDIATLNQIGKLVCDIVIAHVKERFAFSSHLVSATLFAPELFDKYLLRFPFKTLDETVNKYPMLNKEKLRTELDIIYRNRKFHCCSGAVDLFLFLVRNNIDDAFSETCTLLKILITTPMTTSEPVRCFPTLKKIKTFLRSAVTEDRLNALAMLAIEKQLINDIPQFNNQIIEKFAASKSYGAHFTYKSC
ncbi:Hypothetical predicted protein [Pelobates cultripes]|uniref:DUF4371 domain-containing protein n=1 Tax=Pelobates cultripes TaxID=61616 RepID=A0AAD1WS50_PELCU|nr:Hypothetical predicted protein [Pelobates cultripes]